MTFCTVGFLAKRHGVSPSTIRRWEAAGRIEKAQRTLGGHRRFRLTEDSKGNARRKVGYARVSSYDQKKDLERQMERLRAAGCDEVLSDIGSGLNCKKPGLRALLKQLLRGNIGQLVVTHEDRLLRFGVELIRLICRHVRTDIEVLMAAPDKTFEEELARDVITLMTVFCARLYGKRSHKTKKNTHSVAKEQGAASEDARLRQEFVACASKPALLYLKTSS